MSPCQARYRTNDLHIEPGLWSFVKGAAERGEWDHVARLRPGERGRDRLGEVAGCYR